MGLMNASMPEKSTSKVPAVLVVLAAVAGLLAYAFQISPADVGNFLKGLVS